MWDDRVIEWLPLAVPMMGVMLLASALVILAFAI
jgi:hypothetical protein